MGDDKEKGDKHISANEFVDSIIAEYESNNPGSKKSLDLEDKHFSSLTVEERDILSRLTQDGKYNFLIFHRPKITDVKIGGVFSDCQIQFDIEIADIKGTLFLEEQKECGVEEIDIFIDSGTFNFNNGKRFSVHYYINSDYFVKVMNTIPYLQVSDSSIHFSINTRPLPHEGKFSVNKFGFEVDIDNPFRDAYNLGLDCSDTSVNNSREVNEVLMSKLEVLEDSVDKLIGLAKANELESSKEAFIIKSFWAVLFLYAFYEAFQWVAKLIR
jgi:hypothetical protein